MFGLICFDPAICSLEKRNHFFSKCRWKNNLDALAKVKKACKNQTGPSGRLITYNHQAAFSARLFHCSTLTPLINSQKGNGNSPKNAIEATCKLRLGKRKKIKKSVI